MNGETDVTQHPDFHPYQEPATGAAPPWSESESAGTLPAWPPQQHPGQPAPWPGPYAPGASAASAGPPPRRHRRRLLLAAGGAVVLLGAALGALAATGGHGPGGAASLKVAWASFGTRGTQSGTGLAGSWITEHAVIDARNDGLIAHNLTDGRQIWTYPLGAGGYGCAMSSRPADGIGVLAYGTDHDHCDQLIGINLATGAKAWNTPINLAADPGPFPSPIRNPHLSITGSTLAAQGPQGTLVAFDLTSGAPLWHTATDTSLSEDTCTIQDVSATAGLIFGLYSCEGSHIYPKLVGYNATTGATAWSADLSTIPAADGFGLSLWAAPSNGPLLLVDDTKGEQAAYAYTPASVHPLRIDLARYDYNAFDSAGGLAAQRLPHGYAITDGTLFIQSAPAGGIANTITALDLRTGRTLWTSAPPPGASSTIVGADASGVHAVLQIPGQDPYYQLVTYATATGSPRPGPITRDRRFTFDAGSTLYLQHDYLVNFPASVLPQTPELIVLTGASG